MHLGDSFMLTALAAELLLTASIGLPSLPSNISKNLVTLYAPGREACLAAFALVSNTAGPVPSSVLYFAARAHAYVASDVVPENIAPAIGEYIPLKQPMISVHYSLGLLGTVQFPHCGVLIVSVLAKAGSIVSLFILIPRLYFDEFYALVINM